MSEFSENDIAVVGMAARLPGARNYREYWKNLRDGVESITRFSEEDLLAEGVSPETLAQPNYVRAGAVLDDMEYFDPEFFGLSPKEAAIMDPQHRHFLETAWEALEDACWLPETFDGNIAVFAGCGMGAYFSFNILTNPDLLDSVGLFLLRHTGNDKDFLATRVSYNFNLKGPSVNVQTACSTSLVAAHMACQSLLNNECDMALAGGVTIEIPHRRGYHYKENEILSPDGHCRAFDHRSKGTLFGSGAGVVVLRRLQDAEEDGDHIYAVLNSTAINNDGSSKVGYLAPSVDGQAAAIAESLALADLDANAVTYVECHGTGTPMGDPIEVTALTQAYRQTTEAKGFCRIGSVKTNIGHLDTAAGVASLVKVILSLQHKKIPPTINWEAPNPDIDFENSPFLVNHQLYDWPDDQGPRRAGVNSLGVGGTNAHAIVQEYPAPKPSRQSRMPYQLFTISARNKAACDDYSAKLADFLEEYPDTNLGDTAYTLHTARRRFASRRVFVAKDSEEAVQLLRQNDPNRVFHHSADAEKDNVVFMYPGGGAQHRRMGYDLYQTEPEFRKHVDLGLDLMAKMDVDFDLRDLWFADDSRHEEVAEIFKRPAVQLPAIYIMEVALSKLWISKGVEPKCLIGHSLGENSAACVAGVFSFQDGLGLVTLRGKLFETVPRGGMISVPMSRARLEPLLNDDLDLAVVNGPGMCVVSGTDAALDAFTQTLKTEHDVDAVRIRITIAAHSRLLEPILADFGAYLKSIKLNAPKIPFVSNRTGDWITDQQATDPNYWVSHLRHSVFFAEGVNKLLETPGRIFLEVGPGKTLSSLVKQNLPPKSDVPVLTSARHPKEVIADDAFFLTTMTRLWAAGLPLDLADYWRKEKRRRISLPTYAFRHQRYWIEPGKLKAVEDEAKVRLKKLPDQEDWFYRPLWKRRLPRPDTEREKNLIWLVFMDTAGLGQRMVERFRKVGDEVITVYEGDAYQRKNEHQYILAPEHGRDGYESLIADLASHGKIPHRVLHLWTVTEDESFRPGSSFFHRNQERGFYSLFFLAHAIADEDLFQQLHLVTVVNGLQQVADEPVPYPEKATLLGPIKVIPRELSGVTCSLVDIQLPNIGGKPKQRQQLLSQALDALVDPLENECQAEVTNAVVALRDGERWIQDFERESPVPTKNTPDRLRKGGTYLITGGLGGIGLVMAEHLARTVKANLILLSRSGLPDRAEWSDILEHLPDSKNAHRIRAVQNLESLGAKVMTPAADVTHAEAIREAVAEAGTRFGAIHGVIHTAGVVKDDLIQVKTMYDIEDVFTPKIHGTLVLDEVFKDAKLDFMVLFSSTSTVIAPVGQVDYVAANEFLNAFACARNNHRGTYTVSVNWGIWNQVGMAAEAAEIMAGGGASAEPELADHPLYDTKVEEHNALTLNALYSTKTHWILDEHRTLADHALIPGTGYLEMARAALAEHGERRHFEIRDLYFFRPLYVPDDQPKEIRVHLQPDGEAYFFKVQSKRIHTDGRAGWETHAQALLSPFASTTRETIPLDQIDARCQTKRVPDNPDGIRTGQEKHLHFGPRWRVLRTMNFGQGEALAKLRLPDPFVGDLEHFGLHPGLLDLATGYAMDLIEGYENSDNLWVPVSYDRVRINHNLPQTIYSWVKNHGDNRADGETATFDIILADEDGRVLVEVEEFSIRKLSKDIDFGLSPAPAANELEFEDGRGMDDQKTLSPAEQLFRHNLSQGILPEEGAAALARILSSEPQPRIIVSSMDLHALAKQTAESAVHTEADDGARFARPELDNEFVEPRDDIERTLAGIWSNLLGLDTIGIHDSFFDLGGHSLIAVRLFAEIKKAYHVEYPISVLFEAPTIETCAALIRDTVGEVDASAGAGEAESKPESKRTRYTHLVTMHPGKAGKGTPFFLVAGMFGNVLNLRQLANLIGADRPFYGLQARGLYGGDKPHETFEEMARDYIAEIRTVQPEGPYMLGGFSGGGITALEIARQLRESGDAVDLLVMLDTPIPMRPMLTRNHKLKIHWAKVKRQGPGYLRTWARNRREWKKKLKQPQEGLQKDDTEFHSQEIEAAFRRALVAYDLQHYPGRVTLFRPKLDRAYEVEPGLFVSEEGEYVFPDNDWTSRVASLEVHEVPGNHDSMVLEPNVRVLASKLKTAIQKGGLR